ncbi:MAG TPA: hypothetical protein VF140_08560 [Phycicoccus sp.]|nr:hypothetical protein [Phycicoccus sp.]
MPDANPFDGLVGSPREWCRRYTPGHAVHWIQVKMALRTAPIPYTLVGVAGEHATVRHEPTGAEERWRLHDAARLLAATLLAGSPSVELHEHGLLTVRSHDGRRCFFPCRVPEDWGDCTEVEVGGIAGIRLG